MKPAFLLAMAVSGGAAFAGEEPGRGFSARDFLVQDVCVDSAGRVLSADPWQPPPGCVTRDIKIGEELPYYRHDQPAPGRPDGYQRHDSYPTRDRDGNELFLNPFIFGDDAPGNGYDVYLVRNGWVSASGTRDGGGFSTTFFGEQSGEIVPYNGWVFFPEDFPSGKLPAGFTKRGISGRYWEQNGEPWPGVPPPQVSGGSETSWEKIPSCAFGGIGENPVKTLDAIRVVHGYVAEDQGKRHALFMEKGHLEVFYFTGTYGLTRWEVWRPINQLEMAGTADDLGGRALSAASRALPLAGQEFLPLPGRPAAPENRMIGVRHAGSDGVERRYFIGDVRDWSAVTILEPAQAPPICPLPHQNLLKNFHFESGKLSPWKILPAEGPGQSLELAPARSRAARDIVFEQNAPRGGVRHLVATAMPSSNGQLVCQDIPVDVAQSGTFSASARVHCGGPGGVFRLLLQQVDARGKVLLADADIQAAIPPRRETFVYGGPEDKRPEASLLLSSSLLATRVKVKILPDARALRFAVQPLSPGTAELVETNLSREPESGP